MSIASETTDTSTSTTSSATSSTSTRERERERTPGCPDWCATEHHTWDTLVTGEPVREHLLEFDGAEGLEGGMVHLWVSSEEQRDGTHSAPVVALVGENVELSAAGARRLALQLLQAAELLEDHTPVAARSDR